MRKAVFVFILLCLAFVTNCAPGPGSDSRTGSIVFSVKWPETPPQGILQSSAVTGDVCVDYGIDTVRGTVYDSSGNSVASASWPCSAHSGTITSVPAGSNLRVVLEGLSSWVVTWRGEVTGITVYAGQTTNAGTITMYPTSPPSAPMGLTATAGDSQVSLRWNSVHGAERYNIYWATSSGVSKTNYEGVITGVTNTSYTITGLNSGTTYYFRLTAVNSQGEGPASVEVSATPN